MRPHIVAHRGYSSRAPENTMAAFRLGWESGADGVECDIHICQSGEIICIHDKDTSRIAGESLVVAQSKWSELRKLEVGSWKGEAWKGERIPLLKEALREGPDDLRWYIEIKSGPQTVEPLIGILEAAAGNLSRFTVISFDQDALVELKSRQPGLSAYWLSDLEKSPGGGFSPSVDEIVEMVNTIGVDGFGGQSGRGISGALRQALSREGYALNVWTVDDVAEARRLREIGVTSITTNDPSRLMRSLARG